MYDSHIPGEMFKPTGILGYKKDALPKYRIPQQILKFSVNLSEKHPSGLVLIIPHI